ncbi:MAG: hypothetical protein NVS2B12_39530 [Ktedonobacteraceae bacterium]
MNIQDNDGVPRVVHVPGVLHSPIQRLFQTPGNAYEACMQRHERVRITILILAVLSIFLSDVLFFTMHTILPLIAITILSVLLYTLVNKRLRGIEKQLAQSA